MEMNIDGWKFETPVYLIEGKGKWKDKDGTIYNIESIVYPPLRNGKNVYIDSDDGTAGYRGLDEGEILSFEATSCKKWLE